MYQAMNSTVLDGQPVLGASPALSLYFIVFILICVWSPRLITCPTYPS